MNTQDSTPHLSPEWERMVRENEELTRNLEGARRVNARLTQVDFRNADIIDKLQEERDTLRSENERLTRELAEARAETQEQARLLGAGGSREAALHARVRELDEDKARYQWIQDNITSATYKENIAGNLETVTLFDLLPPTVDAARKETP